MQQEKIKKKENKGQQQFFNQISPNVELNQVKKQNLIDKMNYQQELKNNSIRFSIFEKIYKWWYGKTLDFRYSIIPLGFCFLYTYVVWDGSNKMYERGEFIRAKAMIPEKYDKKYFEEYKQLKKQMEQEQK